MNETQFNADLDKLTKLADKFSQNQLSDKICMLYLDELAAVLVDSKYTLEQENKIANLFGDSLHQYLDCSFAHAIATESDIAAKIISDGYIDASLIANSFWHSMFEGLVQDEIALLKVTSDSRVLQIGTGPLPFLAVLYHQNTGCSVTCVEKDESSVKESRKLIEMLGLSHAISIVCAMGQDAVVQGHTHVVVSQHTVYKKEIYAHVRASVEPTTKVLIRTNARIGDIFFKNEAEQIAIAAGFIIGDRSPMGNKTTASFLVEIA